jgi:ribokinase
MPAPRITVVGSINLDLVARCERLPRVGETVTGATFSRVPGGKGANQAVACARLGAQVTLLGAVGSDAVAEEALAELRSAGVSLHLTETPEPTGVALVLVDSTGETVIVVAPGANATLGEVELPEHDAVLCQLEVPDDAVVSAWESCTGMFCLNAAPARAVAVDPDVTVVNRYELEELSRSDGLVAVTLGAEGAVLLEDGEEVARSRERPFASSGTVTQPDLPSPYPVGSAPSIESACPCDSTSFTVIRCIADPAAPRKTKTFPRTLATSSPHGWSSTASGSERAKSRISVRTSPTPEKIRRTPGTRTRGLAWTPTRRPSSTPLSSGSRHPALPGLSHRFKVCRVADVIVFVGG